MKRTLIVASIFLLLSVAAYAANDPGHDSLYVLKFGDSNIAGSINLTGSLNATLVRFTNRAFGDYLDINANGTILGAPSQPRIMAGANTLYVDSSGNLYINTKGGTSGIVQMGDVATNAITLNVSGTIKQQNVNVCLQDGTNCPASIGGATGYTHWRLGSNTGSIANVANNTLVNITAGSGITTTLSGTTITIANTGDTSGSDDVLTTTSHNNASTSDINVTGAYNALNLQIGPAKVGQAELATTINLGSGQTIAYSSGTINANQYGGFTTIYYLNSTGFAAANITSGTIGAARGGTGLASCSDNQVLKWNGGQWTCGTDTSGVGTESDPLWQGNTSTVARAGTCAAGSVVQNTTNAGVQCIAISSGTVTGTGTSGNLSKWTGATSQGTSTIYDNAGNIGIGTASPGSILTVRKADASTGSIADVLQLEHSSTGTTTNGFGTGIVYRIQNSSGDMSDIGAIRTYQWGATGYMEFLTKPSTGVAMTKAMSVNTGGLTVGDGSVNGGIAISGAAFGWLSNNAGAFYLTNAGNNYFAIQAHGNGDILFQTTTSDTERMRILNSGNIGINTASPQDTLTVNGTLNATNIQLATNCADGQILKWSSGVGTCGSDNNAGGTGDLTDVLQGTGVIVTNGGGPQPSIAINTTWLDNNYVGQSEYGNLDTDSTNDVLTTTSHNNASTSDINVTGAYNALNLQIGPAKVGATELATSISLGSGQTLAPGSGTITATTATNANACSNDALCEVQAIAKSGAGDAYYYINGNQALYVLAQTAGNAWITSQGNGSTSVGYVRAQYGGIWNNNATYIHHDGSNGYLSTGAGNIVLSPAGGSVGIGTTPSYKLHVVNSGTGTTVLVDGSGSSDSLALEPQATFHRIAFSELHWWDWESSADVAIFNNGNIGIGTQGSASQRLEVNGSIKITNDAAATGLYLGRADNVHEGGELFLAGAASYPNWTQDSYDNQLRFFTSYGSNVTAWMNNVGAGSLNLDVEGAIYSGGSQVCTAANGICATGSSTAAGWTNTTTQTTTTLNVGIGSSGAPNVPLEVYHGGASAYGNIIRLNQNAIGNSDGPKIGFYKTMTSSKAWAAGIINGVDAGDFIINEDGGITGFGTTRFRIAPGGNIGIGTTGAPTQRLEVSGNLNVSGSGNIYYAGNLTGYGADLAEFIAGEEVSAGDVVVFSETKDTTVIKSTTKYDTRVAGIISTRPSHIMGAGEGNAMLALAGRVPVKVTTEGGPVRRGDLLTTSSTPGHAMRCDDRAKCAGALVGKATESFDGTKGTITALVMLG